MDKVIDEKAITGTPAYKYLHGISDETSRRIDEADDQTVVDEVIVEMGYPAEVIGLMSINRTVEALAQLPPIESIDDLVSQGAVLWLDGFLLGVQAGKYDETVGEWPFEASCSYCGWALKHKTAKGAADARRVHSERCEAVRKIEPGAKRCAVIGCRKWATRWDGEPLSKSSAHCDEHRTGEER